MGRVISNLRGYPKHYLVLLVGLVAAAAAAAIFIVTRASASAVTSAVRTALDEQGIVAYVGLACPEIKATTGLRFSCTLTGTRSPLTEGHLYQLSFVVTGESDHTIHFVPANNGDNVVDLSAR